MPVDTEMPATKLLVLVVIIVASATQSSAQSVPSCDVLLGQLNAESRAVADAVLCDSRVSQTLVEQAAKCATAVPGFLTPTAAAICAGIFTNSLPDLTPELVAAAARQAAFIYNSNPNLHTYENLVAFFNCVEAQCPPTT